MAFALTEFKAYGTEIDEGLTKRFKQTAVLTITAANTNTALDLSTAAGTFWTAVAKPTALAALKDINLRAKAFVKAGGSGLAGKVQQRASYTSYVKLTSAAIAGGAASETLTVTGLLGTDTIISVSQETKNGTATVAPSGWDTQAADSLKVYFAANPGAGGTVSVFVSRPSVTTVLSGSYILALGTLANVPDITFLSGDAPTAYTIILDWELKDGYQPVVITVT